MFEVTSKYNNYSNMKLSWISVPIQYNVWHGFLNMLNYNNFSEQWSLYIY